LVCEQTKKKGGEVWAVEASTKKRRGHHESSLFSSTAYQLRCREINESKNEKRERIPEKCDGRKRANFERDFFTTRRGRSGCSKLEEHTRRARIKNNGGGRNIDLLPFFYAMPKSAEGWPKRGERGGRRR